MVPVLWADTKVSHSSIETWSFKVNSFIETTFRRAFVHAFYPQSPQ